MILWLALPLMCLFDVLGYFGSDRIGQTAQDSRRKAYTTSILLQLRVIKTLLERQSAGP